MGEIDVQCHVPAPLQQNANDVDEDPKKFCCPITLDLMKDPVIAADGNSYERTNIEDWLKTHDTSPLTNEKMVKMLFPNRGLRGEIQEYKKKTENA